MIPQKDKQRIPILNKVDSLEGLKPFPKNARVRIGILGLAYCTLKADISEINFLSHVDSHHLDMLIYQVKRDEPGQTLVLNARIGPGNILNVTVDGSDSLPPLTIRTDGDHLLEDTLNLSGLHGADVKEKPHIPEEISSPIKMFIKNCAFYTEEMTGHRFDIDLVYPPTVKTPLGTRKFGDMIGGKIKSPPTETGNLNIDIDGPLNLHPKYPLRIGGEEITYDIYFLNHCPTGTGGESDFEHYYDLLGDTAIPDRVIKLTKAPDTVIIRPDAEFTPLADIAACNPVVISPSW